MGLLAYSPLIIIGFHCGLSFFLRRKLVPKLTNQQSVIFEEFLCMVETACVCVELSFIKMTLGNIAYLVFFQILNMWWFTCLGQVTVNPIAPLFDVLYDGGSALQASCRILGQLAAVPFALRYGKVIWFFGLLDEHKEFYKQVTCQSDMQVWFIFAAIVEFLITFADGVASKYTERYNYQMRRFLYSASVTFLVFIAFNITGGYFNPVLASAVHLNCSGCTFKEHLLVYWIAAILGAVASKEFLKRYRARKINFSKKKE